MPILHQSTKFRKDRSMIKPLRRYRDFCDFSRRRPTPSWIFKIQNLTFGSLPGANMSQHAEFQQIGQTVAEIWRLNGFKMAAVRHL